VEYRFFVRTHFAFLIQRVFETAGRYPLGLKTREAMDRGAAQAMIEARHLSKSFASRRAVADVSFAANVGEILGILGANGSGKSTTMRLLAGCLSPDSGTGVIAGHDILRARREAQAALGYLPEAAAGFSDLTVLEFLSFAAEARGYWGAARRAALERVAETLDLTTVLGVPLARLSKGWRQRAWLGQAIVHDPPVLLLDEPTDGLDPNQKIQLRRLLRCSAPSKTILMSTHILEEAEELCDRVIIIANGTVIADQPRTVMVGPDGRLADAFARLTGGQLERPLQ
jgi:ABC-2 type transport system ATP-binding protein